MRLTTSETKRYAELVAKMAAPEPATKKAVPTSCTRAPTGWKCSRKAGHDGPCAAAKRKIVAPKKTARP